ncbi:hypothetical protein DFH28DRAFT_1080713 [Melampsora americana]|nr:hypothetical protein DFH28DRAFT_1080713 [Melampsora americana]
MSISDSDRFEEVSSSSSKSKSIITESNLPIISISKPENESDESEESEEEEGSLIFHETVTDPIEHLINSIEKLKTDGNQHFTQRHWIQALNIYNEALLELPPIEKSSDTERLKKPILENQRSSDDSNDERNEEDHVPTPGPSTEKTLDHQTNPEHSLDSRLSACHLKLEDWKSAVEASTASLRDDSTYQKALHRRAQANEKLDTWASLQAALDDYNTLANLSDLPVTLHKEIKLAQARLPLLISERNLGNSVLGKFGLSTDNFKFTPNETGGYSMSFER